jgi:2-oxo-4-hydroxy-4-carboxy-5-ureidoimidazoline decarboxylase
MTLDELNTLPADVVRSELGRCCGSTRWVEKMVERRPFRDESHVLAVADAVWKNLSPDDWKEAFRHHPTIGDVNSLREKFASTATWAAGEQASVMTTTEDVLQALAEGNRRYEQRFGYIFIVFATRKRADEMLRLLNERLNNDPAQEIYVAAAEQASITKLRLQKLLADRSHQSPSP